MVIMVMANQDKADEWQILNSACCRLISFSFIWENWIDYEINLFSNRHNSGCMAYPSDLNFVLDVLKIRFLHRKFCLELLLRFRPTIFFVKELVFEKTPKFNKNILKNYTVLHLRKVNFELAPSEPFLLILCSSIVIH